MKKRIVSALIAFFLIISPVTVRAEEKTAFVKKDAVLYERNDYTGAYYGMILPGSELTVKTENIEGGFIKVTYAGKTGYIQTNTITYDITELMGDKESCTVVSTQRLFPTRNFTECNEDANATLLNYAAYNPYVESYINVEKTDNFSLSGDMLSKAHQCGVEHIIVNTGDGNSRVSFKISTFNIANEDNFDLSFACGDNEINFLSPKSVEQLLSHADIYVSSCLGELRQENSGVLEEKDGYYKLKNGNRIIPAKEETDPELLTPIYQEETVASETETANKEDTELRGTVTVVVETEEEGMGEKPSETESAINTEMDETDVEEPGGIFDFITGNKELLRQICILFGIAVFCIALVIIREYQEQKRRKEKRKSTKEHGNEDIEFLN